MPTVNVALLGSDNRGYAIVVSPWLVIVSKSGQEIIEWVSTHPMKVKFTGGSQFIGMTGNGTNKPKTKKVKPNSALGKYHYTIEFLKNNNKWITVDPDYRVDP